MFVDKGNSLFKNKHYSYKIFNSSSGKYILNSNYEIRWKSLCKIQILFLFLWIFYIIFIKLIVVGYSFGDKFDIIPLCY